MLSDKHEKVLNVLLFADAMFSLCMLQDSQVTQLDRVALMQLQLNSELSKMGIVFQLLPPDYRSRNHHRLSHNTV